MSRWPVRPRGAKRRQGDSVNKKSGSLAERIPSKVWLLISLLVALIVWTILSVMPLTATSFPNVIVTIQQIGVMFGRGVLLNHPETVALLSTWVIERARDGATVEELMVAGREVLRRDQVMDGVADMLADVQVEATFPDGRKLVTLHHPIA